VPKEIQFAEVEPRYVFERDWLAFPARVDGKPVECLVTLELLMARFGAREPSEQAMRQAYREHRAAIQAIARNHIENGWSDEESRVFLTTRFTRLRVTFGDGLGEGTVGRNSAEAAHRMLTDMIGPNAEEVSVEWDAEDGPPDQACISLRISDPSLPFSAKRVLAPKVWRDHTALVLLLAGVWGDLLRTRSRKLILQSG
jgi:hypothetical protein